MHSLYDEYSNILNNVDDWFRFSGRHHQYKFNIDTLFDKEEANKFIKYIFFNEGLIKLLPTFKFPDNRAAHTVSAFFMGILLKEKLGLSVRKLPQVCGEYKKNFIYFWSRICLSHDLAFWLETNEKYINRCKTLEDFYAVFDIKYKLVEDSTYGKLFQNYYKYIMETKKKIDHGIACGVMLYDQFMKQYDEERKTLGKENISKQTHKFSKRFREYAIQISETVARHNLWVAIPEKEKEYTEYELFELIPPNPIFKRIAYSEEDSLLFLLGLVDTLEPIKCCTRKENNDRYTVLKNVYIKCNNRNKSIAIASDMYITQQILEGWKTMEEWLQLNTTVSESNHEIIINFEYERMSENEQAA